MKNLIFLNLLTIYYMKSIITKLKPQMNKDELLHYALTQFRYLKNYDTKNPEESYNKVRASFMHLFKKVVEYWDDEFTNASVQEKLEVFTNPTIPEFKADIPCDIKEEVKEEIKEKNTIDTLPIKGDVILKQGNSRERKMWLTLRDANIRKMYLEAVKNNIPITDDFLKRIAQTVGTNTKVVRDKINNYEYQQF